MELVRLRHYLQEWRGASPDYLVIWYSIIRGGRNRPIQGWTARVSNMIDEDGDLLDVPGWHANAWFERIPVGECVREIWRVFSKHVAAMQRPWPPTLNVRVVY